MSKGASVLSRFSTSLLGDAPPAAPPACQSVPDGTPACCTFVDYLKDTPRDAQGKPVGATYGVMAGVGTFLLTAVGAGIGAMASSSKGKGAAVGGAVGLAASAASVALYTSKWKKAGGMNHVVGACEAASTPPATLVPPASGKPLEFARVEERVVPVPGHDHVVEELVPDAVERLLQARGDELVLGAGRRIAARVVLRDDGLKATR